MSEFPQPESIETQKTGSKPVSSWIILVFVGTGVLLILAAIAGFFLLRQNTNQSAAEAYQPTNPQRPGMKMTDFSLPGMDGKLVKLSDYSGKQILINTWATWCPPCQKEIPQLNDLYGRYQDQNFVVLGIDAGESKDQVLDFLTGTEIKYPILLDSQEKLMDQLGIRDYPTSILVDGNGIIQYVHIGLLTKDTIERDIVPLLPKTDS